MNGYLFKVENGELVCTRRMDGNTKHFYGDDAINRLKSLDSVNFKKAKVTNAGIMLESTKTRLYINDNVLFTKDNYQNCLYNNMRRINKAVVKHNKSVNKGKAVARGVATGVATVGVLAAIGIAIASNNLKDDTLVDDSVLEQMDDDFEFEVPNESTEVIETLDENAISGEETSIDYSDENVLINHDDNKIVSADDLLFELDDDLKVVNLSFDDSFDQVKYEHVYDNFYDIINERAPRWGVSTNLATCFVSQESGGYTENLMQIQWDSWKDFPITVFNYEKGEYEKIVLTDEPEKYANQGITQTISRKELMNPKTNVSVGCIIIEYCFDKMERNVPAAIQTYNYGTRNMNKVLEAAADDLGCTVDDLLDNQTEAEFLNYRYIIDVGDPNYVEHTLRFLQDPNEEIKIKYIDENGEIKEASLLINNPQSTRQL